MVAALVGISVLATVLNWAIVRFDAFFA